VRRVALPALRFLAHVLRQAGGPSFSLAAAASQQPMSQARGPARPGGVMAAASRLEAGDGLL
jgi:hypothetical protein